MSNVVCHEGKEMAFRNRSGAIQFALDLVEENDDDNFEMTLFLEDDENILYSAGKWYDLDTEELIQTPMP